jgi:catechol 2,3-dioxygenase-like lactoylglutathione lyase family enzyme
MSVGLDHAGLSVADLDAAVAFYGAAFGFAPEFPFELGVDGIRGIMLRLQSGGRLELFERPGAEPGPAPESPIAALATSGYGHIAVSAPDIDVVFTRALEAGTSERVSPRASPEPGVRFAFLADPEGNLVELVERAEASPGGLASGRELAQGLARTAGGGA